MTDFHELFMVKINIMIAKKTGASFLVVYVIYGSLVCTDSKKIVYYLLLHCRLHTIYATLKCKFVRMQDDICMFHYVLDNLNWLVFVLLIQFNNQLDV